jgi:hypothetical protein
MWVAVTLWWQLKAKPWLKRYWQYLLIPVGLILLAARSRKTPQVVTSEQVGAGEVGLQATRDYDNAAEKAAQEANANLLQEQMKRDAALSRIDEDAKTIPELQRSPEKATDFLKDVGKKMRED